MQSSPPLAGGENMTSQASIVETTKRFPAGCYWARWTVMSREQESR